MPYGLNDEETIRRNVNEELIESILQYQMKT